jgi:hypothetical protein
MKNTIAIAIAIFFFFFIATTNAQTSYVEIFGGINFPNTHLEIDQLKKFEEQRQYLGMTHQQFSDSLGIDTKPTTWNWGARIGVEGGNYFFAELLPQLSTLSNSPCLGAAVGFKVPIEIGPGFLTIRAHFNPAYDFSIKNADFLEKVITNEEYFLDHKNELRKQNFESPWALKFGGYFGYDYYLPNNDDLVISGRLVYDFDLKKRNTFGGGLKDSFWGFQLAFGYRFNP